MANVEIVEDWMRLKDELDSKCVVRFCRGPPRR